MRSVVRVLVVAMVVMGVGSCADDKPESGGDNGSTTNTAVVSTTTATTGLPY